MKKFIYKNNYTFKFFIVCIIVCVVCLVKEILGYELIAIPTQEVAAYHLDILTINSIFCGFALTNLGILLSISDDQLIKKLEGTSILQKRNTVIVHSIIFGAISIFIALIFTLNINGDMVEKLLGEKMTQIAVLFFFNLEIISLCVSIIYFILSIKKMVDLLAHIYVPKPKFSEDAIDELRKRINR